MEDAIEDEPNPQPGGRLTVPKRSYTGLGCGCLGLLTVAITVGLVVAGKVGERQFFDSPAATQAAAPASSAADAPAPATSAAAVVSDNPAFDLTGSGSDCVMSYGSRPDGRTVTIITVNQPGNIITHVSDQSGNINRHDEHIDQGPNAFVYDFPLGQAQDIGAVFWPDAGGSQSCTIKPAS